MINLYKVFQNNRQVFKAYTFTDAWIFVELENLSGSVYILGSDIFWVKSNCCSMN